MKHFVAPDDPYREALDTLGEIPGAVGRLNIAKAHRWCLGHAVDASAALDIALAMKSTIGFNVKKERWEYVSATGAMRSYVDLLAVFQTWGRRQHTNGASNGAKRPGIRPDAGGDHGW